MSSILKALRRLEEERARKSPVAPEIAANLLRRGAQRRQMPLWVWPTVITVVALTLASLFWALRPPPVKIENASQVLAPPPPPAKISSASSAGPGDVVIIEEVMDQRRPVLLSSPLSSVAVPTPLPARVNLTLPSLEPAVKTAETTMKPAVTSLQERQSPVISAIAWQEESSARMAVVDGLPVMTGEMVGTAKVQEIRRDRILFLEEGRLFMVRIDSQ